MEVEPRSVKLLDHGYVQLVETWGSDERIVEAARMSTHKGFQGWGPIHDDYCLARRNDEQWTASALAECSCNPKSGDEKLLKFLYENKHMTPFEMAGMTIEVQAPIFVFREWHRHRTQCLAPNTEVYFSGQPGKRGLHRITIEELYRRWQPTERKERPHRQVNAMWPRSVIQNLRLRCADEEALDITHTRIVDVIVGEPKSMVTVTTTGGKTLTATREHKVFTQRGWMQLGDAIQQGALLAAQGFSRDKPQRWTRPPVNEATETWRTVFDNHLYEVSSEGRVRAARPITTQRSSIAAGQVIQTYGANGGSGYECVSLRHATKGTTEARLVHTLVLEAFVGPRPLGYEARHLNSNMADARLSNLAWGTAAENAADRIVADRQQRLAVRFEEIVSVVDAGSLPSYDLVVEGPWHNFVANGFVVHNSYNELSARYTPMPDVNYVPTVERLMMKGGKNKQAQGTGSELTEYKAQAFLTYLNKSYAEAEAVYQSALQDGVPKELARLVIPVGRYSRMRASANLRNWLGFLTLRMDSAAQWEIQQYANAVGDIVAEHFPRVWSLFKG